MNIPYTACNTGNYTAGRTQSIQYIVMHYTANNGDTAQNNATYFANNKVSASAHYFVDENEVVQSVLDSDTAWHCGATSYVHPICRNANAIGVEMCSRIDSNGSYYIKDETVANALALVRELMDTYGVPVENVIRHYDVTGKSCPAPWVNKGTDWADFLTCLAAEEMEEEVEDEMVYYEKISDIPDWGYATVAKLLEKGLLNGEDEDGGLNLEHNMLRGLVINDRAGLYD